MAPCVSLSGLAFRIRSLHKITRHKKDGSPGRWEEGQATSRMSLSALEGICSLYIQDFQGTWTGRPDFPTSALPLTTAMTSCFSLCHLSWPLQVSQRGMADHLVQSLVTRVQWPWDTGEDIGAIRAEHR